jgi:Tol biopolymer transport system component
LKAPSPGVIRADGRQKYYLGSGLSPVWSPDGCWLAYTSVPTGGGHCEELEVFVLEIESWEPHSVDLPSSAVVVDWISQDP